MVGPGRNMILGAPHHFNIFKSKRPENSMSVKHILIRTKAKRTEELQTHNKNCLGLKLLFKT
jgi:hypothetical protein